MSSAEAFATQLAGQRLRERLFRGATLAAAILLLLLLGGVVVSLLHGAWPAFSRFRLAFITKDVWNPVTDQYGALSAIYGTLVTSALAMIFALPVSFGIAVFLTELAPPWLQAPGGRRDRASRGHSQHHLRHLGAVRTGSGAAELRRALDGLATWGALPLVGALFQGAPYGIGFLTAGIVLAIMIVPFISAVMRDVFETVPDVLKESGYGLGATTWEVIWKVVVPYSRTGMIGGIMLGLGRALGETMAVTFVIGNAHQISASLLAPGTTISAAIANEFTEATTPLYTSSLIALGVLLFVITFAVIAAARLMLLRLGRRALASA